MINQTALWSLQQEGIWGENRKATPCRSNPVLQHIAWIGM